MSEKPSTQSLQEIVRTLDKESDTGVLARFLATKLAEKKEWSDPSEIQLRAESLEKLLSTYNQTQELKIGDVVRWKPGMKNRKRPAYGEPCVVIRLLDLPVYDKEADSGSPYFNEPLNVVLGVLDEDGDFTFWHFDKSRFEPIPKT